MKRYYLISAIVALVFTGCGGGSGGSSSSNNSTPSGVITGTAAKGIALGSASLQVCGMQNRSLSQINTTTLSDGTYNISMGTIQGPYLMRVQDTSVMPNVWYYSFAATTGTIANVNPYADIILRTWYNVNDSGLALDSSFCQAGMPIPASTAIASIDSQTKTIMNSLYPSLQGLNLGSVISSAWLVGGGYDSSLDNIGPNFLTNVQATVQTVIANPNLLMHFLLRSGVQNQFSAGVLTKVQPMLHSEIFIAASQIETSPGVITLPALSCPGRGVIPNCPTGVYTDCFGVICPAGVNSSFCFSGQGTSAIAGTYDIFICQDQVSSMITGNCTLSITKNTGSVVNITAPVIMYEGTGITNIAGTRGNSTVSWTNPADLLTHKPPVSVYLVGYPESVTNPGRTDALNSTICPNEPQCSDTLPITSTMGFTLLLTGANGELAEAAYNY
jgi:hypothetical protein